MPDPLGDRMKTYEQAYNIKLPARLPIIIRVDGKAFHTLTRGCNKPFDNTIIDNMNRVAAWLLKEIDGAVFAYVQSDEVSVLVNNYQSLSFSPYFDNKLQKLCSIAASVATASFNLSRMTLNQAMFDARAFVLPKEEVVNYFIWRQRDWERNSVSMLGRTYFSHNELEHKRTKEVIDMLHNKHDVSWNQLPTHLKRGRAIYPIKDTVIEGGDFVSIHLDLNIPRFEEDRQYIQKWVDYVKIPDNVRPEDNNNATGTKPHKKHIQPSCVF